jgi:hypothetical protein
MMNEAVQKYEIEYYETQYILNHVFNHYVERRDTIIIEVILKR